MIACRDLEILVIRQSAAIVARMPGVSLLSTTTQPATYAR